MQLDSTNFTRNGNSGLYLQKGDCVSPIDTLRPFGGGQLSQFLFVDPAVTLPVNGLAACWGWTPTGQFQLGNNCAPPFGGEKPQDTNTGSREYIIDAVHFIAPSPGTLRLYVRPTVPNVQPTLEVNVRNNCVLPTERVKYTLSQWLPNFSSTFIPPGAYYVDSEIGTSMIIVDLPAPYPWTPGTGPKLITPMTLGIITRGDQSISWGIAF